MMDSYHPDVPQPAILKRKIDFSISDEELDIESVDEDHDSQMSDIHRYIDDEINLEVAIRERLATSIEGRIEWALQMLNALANAKEAQGQALDGDDFQDAAFDALEASETSSSFLFDTPLPEERSPSPSVSPIVPNHPPPQRVPKTRSTRTPKPSQQKKHLYIKLSPGTSDCQFAILACPTCGRTQFTNLQGLLNHARMAHSVEWASHDTCITACAVLLSGDNAQHGEIYERDGVELPWSGNVVGLRRLFERAVGVDGTTPTTPLSHVLDTSSATAPSTLLSRTLGLHADSPALAQFLGRAPKRRCIHVHDEEQYVDIITRDATTSRIDDKPANPKKGFYMHYPHRNTARNGLDLVIAADAGTGSIDADAAPAIIPAGTTTSRFHITARIRLEDRSLFLKEDRRTQLRTNDEYRWMLGVTAPSYSLPLSSFLTCVTVVPPRTVSPMFLTVQHQPFAVVGTANEPFVAKVVLEWAGGGKTEVEHWVELDQSKSCTSVFGSEQLLDIELDRNTPLLPAPSGSPPPLPTLDLRLTYDTSSHNSSLANLQHGEILPAEEEYFEQVLRSLLPRVPMTAKDVKPRVTTQVPYMLVASPTHFLALMPGRRKAIEWARARALHALYVDHMASVLPCQRIALTVGDVYMFLEDDSHFPRPSNPASRSLAEKKKGREKDGTPIFGDESCPICGIRKSSHPGYDVKNEEAMTQWTCAVVSTSHRQYGTRLPLVNLAKLLALPDLEQTSRNPPSLLSSANFTQNEAFKMFLVPFPHAPRDLIKLSPPELILSVHKIMSRLRLAAFSGISAYGRNPSYLASREHTEGSLTPAALLSLALKPFISTLLRSAIEIAKQDITSVTPGTKSGRGKKTKKLTPVLSPGHILRGLWLQSSHGDKAISGGPRITLNPNHWGKTSAALCLARLGVRFDANKDVPAGLGTRSAEHLIGHTAVKAEPE